MELLILTIAIILSAALAVYNFYQAKWYIEDRYKREYIAWYRWPLLEKKYFSDLGWDYRNKAIFFPIFITGTALVIIVLMHLFNIKS